MSDKFVDAFGKAKVTLVDKAYDWGIYVWKKSDGKWFTDGQGNILNIPSRKHDENQIQKLRDAAAYHGEPDGKEYFFAGLGRVTDEEYSEQVDRMKEGLIPNLNDLGAVHAAQQTLKQYGDEG
jgi:phosphoglucomutase